MRSTRPTEGAGTPTVVRTMTLLSGNPNTATSWSTGRIREQSSGTTPESVLLEAAVAAEPSSEAGNVGRLGPGSGAAEQPTSRVRMAPIRGRASHCPRRTGAP